MLTLNHKNIPLKTALILISLGIIVSAPCFAQQSPRLIGVSGSASGDDMGAFSQQARMYRSQGQQLQNSGNIDAALALYKKATELDPMYAPAYNDLGVMYETKGMIDEAEVCYLRAIK
ncbi:MAG: tetratricopeptide repeat protein, partial [Candidatus Omnitrophica bacterium]|nr:tetratricopeptide repeat protein [Candidatus Omnitrophota bacterium]